MIPDASVQTLLDLRWTWLRVLSGPTAALVWRCIVLTAMFTGLFCSGLAAQARQTEIKRPFTVKDSIEISYIVNSVASTIFEQRGSNLPIGIPIISPDRSHFLLVTQRGVLSSNCLEATVWLLDRQVVRDYVLKKSSTKPIPRPIATLRASSNTPVISDVRWLDSGRIAFLGKSNGPYQQLFVEDLSTSTMSAITKGNVYVTAYDISGDTIAYTTLMPTDHIQHAESDVVDVAGKDLVSLLYPSPRKIEDIGDLELQSRPSTLNVQRNGEEVTFSFTMGGKPLKLFVPTLAVSPNGNYLITVAPVREIPSNWGNYQPYVDDPKYMKFLRLKPGNDYAFADENLYKASQWVVINLQNGQISPLVDAPAGRGLGYNVPTKAFWLADSRRAIVSNTFIPLDHVRDERDRRKREQAPTVGFVDVTSRQIEPITYLRQSAMGAKEWYRVGDVTWDEAKNEITLRYHRGPNPDQASAPPFETYKLISRAWTKLLSSASKSGNTDGELELSVEQELNHPPVLKGQVRPGSASTLVWDPNSQLENISLVEVSIYQWKDKNGNSWSGLLVPPANHDPKGLYPLVIQLYGYEPDRFFVDGAFTTGFAGRALSGKGIAVLQIAWPTTYFRTSKDGPYQIDGFESAIEHLSADGLIDPHRVGVIGFSYSSYHLLYAITHRPDLFAAASFSGGNTVSYWQYLLSTDTEDSLQGLSEETNGGAPFGQGLRNWMQNAPGFNLDKARTPLLISSFEVGSLLWHWEPYSVLRALKKPVDMVWLREGNWPHILVQPAHRYISQQLAVDWFSFWLKGEEDSDPGKEAEYVHWRELRNRQERKQ
jgi:hypothetical protein